MTCRRHRRFALLVVGVALSVATVLAGSARARVSSRVLVTRVDGTITPVVADHVDDAVARAANRGYQALVVELDTPGGLDSSMREIIQDLLNAPLPVVVYVSPSGARAASAGALITMAAHVAAMAPATNIGAATPVDIGGGEVGDKVVNDARAFAEAIARARGRDVEFARRMVTKGASVAETEALERGVVDLVAESRTQLLEELDGRSVELPGGRRVVLATAGAEVDEFDLSTFRSILQRLADPNLAFVFLSLGSLGILYELANPGVGAGGIVGAIMLILGLFALAVLPVNVAGLGLLLLALALFIGELFVPGVGVMAAGGAVSLLLGGLFLFRDDSIGVELPLLVPAAVVLGSGAVVIGRFAWRTRRAPPRSAADALVGRTATVRTVRDGTGQVFLDGAWWRVRYPGGEALRVGQVVRVVERQGLDLVVEVVEDAVPGGVDARTEASGERREES